MYLRFEPVDLLFGYLIFGERYASGHSMCYGVAYTCIYIYIYNSFEISSLCFTSLHRWSTRGSHRSTSNLATSILMYTMAS